MIKNIFLDRDGIINEVVFRDGKPASPRRKDEFIIRKDFVDFYSQLPVNMLNIFIVSNQPDISRQKMELVELDKMSQAIQNDFKIKAIRYCTHDDMDNCLCRKPKPGMIKDLIKEFKLKEHESILIGDSWKDIIAGNNAGIKTIFLEKDYNTGTVNTANFTINKLINILELKMWEHNL